MKKNILITLVIFFATCILMLLYGGFSWDVFLVDDNVCQWYPITEKAYEQFFKTGVMPSYNFFLLNGFPIANMGYYSLYNPFMLISYILERILPFNMFAIYICILSGLGNVFFFLFCRAKNVCLKHSVLFVVAYSSAACFMAFHNWYYAFNNYFIIPLLLCSIFVDKNKKTMYVSGGAILALDILLGNVQFVCFHYIVYVFLMFGLWLFYRSNYIYRLIGNICVGLFLSAPILLLGLNASADFGGNRFLAIPTSYMNFILSSAFLTTNSSIPWQQQISYAAPLTVSFLIGGTYVVFLIVFGLKGEKKSLLQSNLFQECFLLFLLILFWQNYNEGGTFAILMSKMPVISKFRYLYKAYFIIIPLLALYLVFLNGILNIKVKKILYKVILLLSFIGLVNNFIVYNHTRSLFIRKGEHYSTSIDVSRMQQKLKRDNIQYNNYRIASFYSDDSISKDKFLFYKSLNRNYPALLGAFSLAAYEIASSKQTLKKFNYIYSDSSFMTIYGNTGVKSYLVKNLDSNTFRLESQLKSNSVKYLLLKQDSIIPLDTLVYKMKAFNAIHVERVAKFNELFDLVVLGEIPSLCRFADSIDVPLTTEQMDLLSFKAERSGKYVLSFSYNDKLQAYFIRDDGNKEFLDLEKEIDGNISIPSVPKGEKIYLTYNDPLCQWAKLSEVVTSILFVVVLVAMFKPKGNTQKC